jgi:glucosamine--fructose-6-phosphate aminotransferase (isomerizing)
VVVHNGIIENYLDLKQQLQKEGHTFVTETDTEIVAHLVEREMKDDGLENAVRRALLYMRGLFALVLIADDPNKIVTVRNGSPIVVSLGRILCRVRHPHDPGPHLRRRFSVTGEMVVIRGRLGFTD